MATKNKWKNHYKTIGNRLYHSRKNMKLTRRRLSELANCSTFTIEQYERDKVNPSLFIIADIAKVLNVSIDYLVYGKADN